MENNNNAFPTITIKRWQIALNIFRALFKEPFYIACLISFIVFPFNNIDIGFDNSAIVISNIIILLLIATIIFETRSELNKSPNFIKITLLNESLKPNYLFQKDKHESIAYQDIQYIHIQKLYEKFTYPNSLTILDKVKYYGHQIKSRFDILFNIASNGTSSNEPLDFKRYVYLLTFYFDSELSTSKKESSTDKKESWSIKTSSLSNDQLFYQTLSKAGVLFVNKPLKDSDDSSRKEDSYKNKITVIIRDLFGITREDIELNNPEFLSSDADVGHHFLIVILVSLVGFVISFYGYQYLSQAQHLRIGYSLFAWSICLFTAWRLCYPFIKKEGKAIPLLTTMAALPFATVFLHDAYTSTRWLVTERFIKDPYTMADIVFVTNRNGRSVWRIDALKAIDTQTTAISIPLINQTFWLDFDEINIPLNNKNNNKKLSLPLYCSLGDCFIPNTDLEQVVGDLNNAK